nr:unnamed protein product [Callosobruchus chinensis]
MPSRVSCKCCNQVCETHLVVTCSVCKDKFKHSCVDISSNEVRTLNCNKGYDWTCVSCRSIGKDMKDLKSLIIQLQTTVNELKAANARINSTPAFDYEDMISEITERQKRKCNIMVFNVSEPDQNKPAKEQSEADKRTVENILNHVAPELDLQNVASVRVGRFLNSKKRPIKIVLGNADTVRKVLINAKKIKSNNDYKHVSISSDRTKKQIEYFKAVKQELDDRIRAGDTNCRIKYFNDVPRIVTLN